MSLFYQQQTFICHLINLCKECNAIALSIYNDYLENDIDITYKEDDSPLTQADLEVNRHICNELNKLEIHSGKNILIISEENKKDLYENRRNYDWVWLIDPIDGTKEFIHKNGQFTVNIGLCYKGEPVFGIVGIPVLHEIYYGCNGRGSYKIKESTLEEIPIRVSSFDYTHSKLNIVCSKSHINKQTKDYLKQFKHPNIKSYGSSIKILKVAEGSADIYPRIGLTSEWDTCASHAILIFAGGKMVNYNSGETIQYNKENLLNPYFICYGQCDTIPPNRFILNNK